MNSSTTTQAILALADGTIFRGVSIGSTGHRVGEVVFNTAMTGYQEILTDPSYARQLVPSPILILAILVPTLRIANLATPKVMIKSGQRVLSFAMPL